MSVQEISAVIEYSEKRSKFLVYVFSVNDREEFKVCFNSVREIHKKAKHVLKAGRYQNNYGLFVNESSEDKEPISSMKNLVSLMEKKGIENKAVFIVRYFGGTLLGASHLDRLYLTLGLKALGL